MNFLLEDVEDCAEYRGVNVCLIGTIDNWQEVAKDNYLVAENQSELVAWWVYHSKPLEVFKGNYVILQDESVSY